MALYFLFSAKFACFCGKNEFCEKQKIYPLISLLFVVFCVILYIDHDALVRCEKQNDVNDIRKDFNGGNFRTSDRHSGNACRCDLVSM